jgi:hypothetical protein
MNDTVPPVSIVRLTGTIGILAKAVRLRICDVKTADRVLRPGLKNPIINP